MPITVPETVYDAVSFKGSVGTLKLSDQQLSFHTFDKVSVLPWKKVVRRQVASAASKTAKPMFKLILESGTEAVFQMEDRVSLEVLRDDLGERLKTWRRMNPVQEDNVAVNKTKFTGRRESTPYRMVNTAPQPSKPQQSSRRASCVGPSTQKAYSQHEQSRRASYTAHPQKQYVEPQQPQRHSRRASYMGPSTQKPQYAPQQEPQYQPRRSSYHMGSTPQKQQRGSYVKPGQGSPERSSASPPPYCRNLSAETIKKNNNRHGSFRY